MPRLAAIVLIVLALATSTAAIAHGVIMAVWAAGDVIEGEVAFTSGEPAPVGTRVSVVDEAGNALGEASVEADGLFRFRPETAVAHRFIVDLGQGHVATATLGVDALPAGLAVPEARALTLHPELASAPLSAAAGAPLPAGAIEQLVAAAVQRELAPLRRELQAQRRGADIQAVIGGLGYICGIFGLLFFIYARRRSG